MARLPSKASRYAAEDWEDNASAPQYYPHTQQVQFFRLAPTANQKEPNADDVDENKKVAIGSSNANLASAFVEAASREAPSVEKIGVANLDLAQSDNQSFVGKDTEIPIVSSIFAPTVFGPVDNPQISNIPPVGDDSVPPTPHTSQSKGQPADKLDQEEVRAPHPETKTAPRHGLVRLASQLSALMSTLS